MNKKRDKMAEECKDAYFNGDGYGSQESVQRPDLSFKAGWDACEKESAMEIAELVEVLKNAQETICSEFCGQTHHEVCDGPRLALAKYGDKK